jgi:hypothetical protein
LADNKKDKLEYLPEWQQEVSSVSRLEPTENSSNRYEMRKADVDFTALSLEVSPLVTTTRSGLKKVS